MSVVLFVGFVLIAVTGALARSARSARSSSGFYTAHQDSGFAKLEDISSKGNQFVERHSRNGRYDSSVPQLEEQKIPVHVVYYYPEEVISHNIGQAVQNTTVASISNSSWHDQPKEDAHSSTEQREDLNTTGQENVTTHGITADVCRKLDGTTSRQSKQMREFDEVSQSDRRGRGGVITFEKSRPSWPFLGNARDNSGNVRTIPEIETEVDSIKDLDTISASSNKSTLEIEEDIEELRKNKDDETEIVMSSGNRKGAGPFITRLVVRRGGVSIAGPGGVATAGSGGTAIVGPGGVAYTSPNGLAVVGPGGKVVSLPSGLDVVFTQDNSTSNDFDGSQPRVAKIPPGGRLLATGPIVYYHQPE
uniref:DUF4774 domain-containing protein n=1 Tax=Timema shepardi TaxID=629360 RepID=A0A7R9B177_TIMSH|nr:unnamed protein product [Timema shepardi]